MMKIGKPEWDRDAVWVPEHFQGRRHRFVGVCPCDGGGWEARINVPGGNVERLGVWGTALDAAIARNVWIANWGEDYFNFRYNMIPDLRKVPTDPSRFVGVRPCGNLWQAFSVGENGEHIDLGTFGFAVDAAIAVNYYDAYHGRPIQNEISESEMYHD
jgi:hypothetical protein